jgi:soluble lytic murein transglycosylase-like protein
MRRTLIIALAAASAITAGANAGTLRVDADVAYVLGLRYENGEGIERDYARAAEFYCDADRLGHAGATYAIGWMYANGQGADRDDTQAAAWLRRAELRGHPQAAALLKTVADEKAASPLCPQRAEQAAADDSTFAAHIVELVKTMAPFYRIEPGLALAVIHVESAFRQNARSHKKAQGLMQLIPATAARFGVTDRSDPVSNLHGGLSYLSWLIDHFRGDVRLALAGYNAGERAVARHRGVPPYPETRNYIKKIAAIYPELQSAPVKAPERPQSAS